MRKKIQRFMALFTVINLVVEIFFPAVSYALTSGPSQPEHVQFAPVGANNSVDLFSGDFSYNIPLFELPGPDGGYPFNLSYQAGVGVEEEASWVGLGWNLTPGAINRQMRGLPDEFKGDVIEQEIYRKPNTTVSTSLGGNLALELFGYDLGKATKLANVFKNTPLGGINLSAGLTLSVRNNNYTGVGYSFAPTFSYGMDIVNKNLENIGVSGMSLGRTHNLTVYSESGINSGVSNSINFNFSVSKDEYDSEQKKGTSGLKLKDYDLVSSNKRVGLGLTHSKQYNSRQGLLSKGYSLSTSLGKSKTNHTTRKTNGQSNSLSGNWSLDFTNNGYMPSIATPTLVVTTSFMAKVGLAPKGIYGGSFNVSGTVTSQGIRYDKREDRLIRNSAYGYNHSEENKGLMDINRERDKIIDKETKTLPTPNFTYDTYMVTGQGITGMFRPYRGEVGVLGDNYAKSITRSGSAGLDISSPVPDSHWGINLEYTGGSSKTEKQSQIGKYGFKSKQTGSLHEPLYYKFQGEASIKPLNSLEKIGNHLPVRFDLNEDGSPNGNKITYSQVEADITDGNSSISALATATMTNTVVTTKDATLDPYFNQGRDSRNTLIQEVTKEHAVHLPEFAVEYKESTSEDWTPFSRSYTGEHPELHLKDHHLAGFICTNAGGSRYVYGLPAYNREQKEIVKSRKYDNHGSENEFKEDGSHLSKLGGFGVEEITMEETEKYTNETTTPAYPYAYLLTSILGTDYIDVDYNNPTTRGISENDLGYWVKFGYERVHQNYEWRSPYVGVNFTEGLRNTNIDDKASYASGKKDIYYVQKVETKSHVAIFYTSVREDAKSANIENGGIGDVGAKSLKKLDRIALFTRAEYDGKGESAKPIKEIHFDYKYELCKGTPNGAVSEGGGKLTLKKIWFTYQGVNRGMLSPYEFEYYNTDNLNNTINYVASSQDRWGVFAPRNNSPENKHKTHASFPYVDQTLDEVERNKNVSAWNLKEIKMPTGSRMKIEYESDDYAYVQDKKAMQMYPFSVEENPFSQNDKETLPKEILSNENLRIYFRLQDDDIQTGLTEEQAAQVVNRYLDGREQVYVKTLIGLRKDKDFEDMSAYLDIKSKIEEGVYSRGITPDGNYGYITLKPAKDTEGRLYHPLTVASWIKLKTEHSRLLLTNNEMNDNQDNPDWNQLTKMFSAFQALREVRGNYYDIAKDSNWGRKIKHQYSYVKLNNTKGHKYGGGYRVKQVEFWDGTGSEYNPQSTYGQVYDYTTQEDGKTISSGVASYEPLTGGDENALRYAEKYIKDIPGKSKHAMGLTGYEFYVEYPVNEGYYPGAKVGYSKVTVKSLATAKKIEQINTSGEFANVSTTGLTINEFYTTKDFPTLAAQTDIDHQEQKQTRLSIFPFFAKTKQKAGMSQGFVVEVNNMDGKPKAMYHYGQNDKGEVLYDKPISSSQYFYKTKQRGKHQVLDNACQVLVEEKNGNIKKEERLVGVEYDVFIDSRKSTTKTTRAGGNFNTNIIVELGGVPIPTLFFSSSGSEETVNITTINKIIYRSGILDYVKVSDGLSTSTTQNLLWDANTGGVLLTSVNNNFDDKIYSYTIPAYTQYDEMGAAYRNIGLRFDLPSAKYVDGGRMYNLEAPIPKSGEEEDWKYELWTDELVPGDELIVDFGEFGLRKAIYMGADRKTQRFQFFVLESDLLTNFVGIVDCTIMRSGRRNLLAASAGNITSLKDPTETGNRTKQTFSGKSTITKEK